MLHTATMTFPQNGAPRSTPIPGTPLDVAPPTPAQYLGGQTTAPPTPGFGQQPGFGVPQPGFGGQPFGTPFAPVPRKKKRRGAGMFFFWLFILIGPAIGIGVGVWAVFKANDAVNEANDLSNPDLSGKDRDALGLGNDVTSLFDPTAAGALATTFEDGLAGDPTQFTEIVVYPDYAFATIQDPDQPSHIDRFGWRSGKIDGGTPQPSFSGLEPPTVFSEADVNWDAIADLAAQAPALAGVEEGKVSHVIINRSVFRDGDPLTINVYVSGPRGSAYIEADAQGTVVAVH